jgi:Trp operon repressor
MAEKKKPAEKVVTPWEAEYGVPPPTWEKQPWGAKVLSSMVDVINLVLKAMWAHVIDVFVLPLWRMWRKGYKEFGKQEDKGWEVLFKFMQDNGILSKTAAKSLLQFRGLPGVIQSLFNLITASKWLSSYIGVVSNVTLSRTEQALNAEFTPTLAPAQTLIAAAFTAPEKTGEIRQILKRQGLADDQIDLMFIAAYRLYDVGTVRDLFYRGVLSDAEVVNRMQQMGFTETRIKEIRETWAVIPPLQDIIRMAVRETFTPEIAEKFGQFENLPGVYVEWAKKQGLSEDWAAKYWAAHWDLPSLSMGYEMLHRGVIDDASLDLLLRAQDVMPFWREKLKEISYNVYTRVDLRRMHQMGVVSDADLIKNYMDQGYDREHAERMAEFTVRYNAQDKLRVSVAQIIKAYRNLMITRSEAHDLMVRLKLSEESIEFNLAQADFEENLEVQNLLIDAVKTRFVNNLMDEMDARGSLMKNNLPGARIDALIEKWTPVRILDQKIPSKTDLDKMLKAGIIDEAVYVDEMTRLGYNMTYIGWYLALHKTK